MLTFEKTNASPVWPAAGVGLGALFLFGYRLWPGIFLGAYAASVIFLLHTHGPALRPVLAASVGNALGSTLEPVVGVWLLGRWLGGRRPLDRPEDVFRFGAVVLAIAVVSAAIGPLSFCLAGLVPWHLWPMMTLTWWVGDVSGMLVAAPIAAVWQERHRPAWTAARIAEAVIALLVLVMTSGILFEAWWPRSDWNRWKYFALAPLLWVATRLGRRETAFACFILSIIAVWGTVHERGAFGSLPMLTTLISLGVFIAFASLTALVISAAVAERKEAEGSIRMVLDAAPNGMVMVNSAGQITLVNAQMERLFGYDREAMLGQPIELLIPARFRAEHPGMRKEFSTHPQARPMGAGRDLFGRRKDGSEFPVEIGLAPIKIGQKQSVLASVIDITARKRAEAALRQSEERFRVIAETVPSMLFTTTPEGLCDYTSKSFQEYTGTPPVEAPSLDLTSILHPEDVEPVTAEWQHSLRSGELFRIEHRFRRHDGAYRWFLAEAHPVQDEAGRILKWVGALTDIHEEKQARELLEATVTERTAALQASLNSMEELLYTIAHDLRAPNRTMKGFAQLLQVSYRNKLDATAGDYLERISAAAERNDQLICDLLDYGRISHEPVPLAAVDVRQTVEAVLHEMEGEIQHRRAHVRLGQEWPRVLGNESLLKQILLNLVSNALKYVPPDREPEVVVSAERHNGQAVLKVKDNGIGIPSDQVEKVFQPFMRLPNALESPGTGMGLAIVKKATERMHGEVGVEPTLDRGSCFWLKLPAA